MSVRVAVSGWFCAYVRAAWGSILAQVPAISKVRWFLRDGSCSDSTHEAAAAGSDVTQEVTAIRAAAWRTSPSGRDEIQVLAAGAS